MSIFGNSWKNEPSDEEKYEEITGQKYNGDNLIKDIEKEIKSSHTSKESRKQLFDLLSQINQNNK